MYFHTALLKFIAFKIILPFVAFYLIILGLVFYYQRALLYFPQPAVTPEQAATLAPGAELIEVTTKDQIKLKAYFIPPKTKDAPIILVFHGNAALGLYLGENFRTLAQKDYGVLLAEYRGYGGNGGSPSEIGLSRDADAYLEYLKNHYPNHSIMAYGQSLGGGVAVDLLSRHPDSFKALVLEVPFDSVLNVSNRVYPYILFKKIMLKDPYLSIEKIGSITVPKLFLLAGEDEVVGLESGLNLFAAAPEPKAKIVFDHAQHGTVYLFGAEAEMVKFLESL